LHKKKGENANLKRNQRIVGMHNKEAMKSIRRLEKYLINKEVMKLGMPNKEVLKISRSTQQTNVEKHQVPIARRK
jgi:hypothetical protein